MPLKTEEEARIELKEQAETANRPEVIDLETYFSIRGVRDVPTRAAMMAYTRIKKASLGEWDLTFASF